MIRRTLEELGISGHERLCTESTPPAAWGAQAHEVHNPATGERLAWVRMDTRDTYEEVVGASVAAFERWRNVPAPVRGQLVRAIGDEFRRLKAPLGRLISLEVGKIREEGLGEVQETIDIADFAVGLSRQLYGLTMPSERESHRMFEQWLPLGPVGVISAFNFPNAVWAWNAMIAAVCGDSVVWKPSMLAPLTAIASQNIAAGVAEGAGYPGLFGLVFGPDDVIGETMTADPRLPLISATGSTRMGRHVAQRVAQRLGRTLLELGGNNAVIVDRSTDLNLAIPAIVFAAVGTAGQRCTTTRRLIVHTSIADEVLARLSRAYDTIRIGDPLAEGTLVGPLIGERAVLDFEHAVSAAIEQGGVLVKGGKRLNPKTLPEHLSGGQFVEPTILRAPASNSLPVSADETFAPILYVFTFEELADALAMNNGVAQGLSSAIFTDSVRTAEVFLSPAGSDCGIANVNIGTSGAEIGGAFGGEKDTGGGRESGSDSWKAYMRRQTCTINYGTTLRLAQGIRFE
ncbi:MAG: aldehyde dehydrogenase family protein [Phycisphaeraceae bacterium]|nr:aldehyde dehydrogenase family protein [Phycisphaeraceae bacterium]